VVNSNLYQGRENNHAQETRIRECAKFPEGFRQTSSSKSAEEFGKSEIARCIQIPKA
jgi:hypothetical protein